MLLAIQSSTTWDICPIITSHLHVFLVIQSSTTWTPALSQVIYMCYWRYKLQPPGTSALSQVIYMSCWRYKLQLTGTPAILNIHFKSLTCVIGDLIFNPLGHLTYYFTDYRSYKSSKIVIILYMQCFCVLLMQL